MTYPSRGEFSKDMGEISGFGGGYEAACRKMLRAGVAWIDEHKNEELKFSTLPGVYGLLIEDNEAAKELSRVITDVVENDADGGATGAMHQAVTESVMFIAKNGWEKYVDEMRDK